MFQLRFDLNSENNFSSPHNFNFSTAIEKDKKQVSVTFL